MIKYNVIQGPMKMPLYFSTDDLLHHILAKNTGTLYLTNRKNVPKRITVLPEHSDVEDFVQLEIQHGRK